MIWVYTWGLVALQFECQYLRHISTFPCKSRAFFVGRRTSFAEYIWFLSFLSHDKETAMFAGENVHGLHNRAPYLHCRVLCRILFIYKNQCVLEKWAGTDIPTLFSSWSYIESCFLLHMHSRYVDMLFPWSRPQFWWSHNCKSLTRTTLGMLMQKIRVPYLPSVWIKMWNNRDCETLHKDLASIHGETNEHTNTMLAKLAARLTAWFSGTRYLLFVCTIIFFGPIQGT